MKSSSYNQYLALRDHKDHAKLEKLENDILLTVRNVQMPSELMGLYDYLTENHSIVPLRGYDEEVMDIFSRNVLEEILANADGWEEKVPDKVAKAIKEHHLFGYKGK